jgi:hypothetical protein
MQHEDREFKFPQGYQFMIKYTQVINHIKTKTALTPIKLKIGTKEFDGVEFPDDREDDIGNFVESWLLIKASPKDVKFLDNGFYGKKFDIFGETMGKDFRFMGKSKKFRQREVEWDAKTWKEYRNRPCEFELLYPSSTGPKHK